MAPPSLCGSFLSSKQSLVAFIWSVTTLLQLIAFIMAIIMTIQINVQYKRMARMYAAADDDVYNNNNGEGEEEREGGSQDHNSADNESLLYSMLASTSSRSMTFVAIYTMTLAMALNLYGSTAIVGFTSLQGVYIAPCFSSEHSSMKVGMFGGAIVIFANLLLLCAVVLGEFRVSCCCKHDVCLCVYVCSLCAPMYLKKNQVEDYRDNREEEDYAPYAVERIATVLAVTCMFLSALYTIFAVLLFLSHTADFDDSKDGEERHSQPLVTISDHDNGFITMGESRSS